MATALRIASNTAYREGRFADACDGYTRALALLMGCEEEGEAVIILGNRCSCHLALGQFALAELDIRQALEKGAATDKSFFRLYSALQGQAKCEEAERVLCEGLAAFPASEGLLKLRRARKISSRSGGFLKTKPQSHGGSFGFSKEGAIILESAPEEELDDCGRRMIQEVRKLVRDIQQGRFADLRSNHKLPGVFKQLCDKSTLLDLLFPGVPALQLEQLPQTLRDVLMWRELIVDVTQVAKSAASVLEGLKRKANGEIDQESEGILSVQIVQEALARELVASVRRLAKQMSQVSARMSLSLASPTCENALSNLLDDDIAGLLYTDRVACQDDFLGPDWAALVLADVERFVLTERLSKSGGIDAMGESAPAAFMAYIDLNTTEGSALEENYPALGEAMKQIHKLPYELNAKLGSKMQLLEPAKGCTMLFSFPANYQQQLRLDNVADVLSDSGVRLTCAYHLVPANSDSTESASACRFGYCQAAGSDTELKYVDVIHDRLIMHHSTEIRNERTLAARNYFTLLFLGHTVLP